MMTWEQDRCNIMLHFFLFPFVYQVLIEVFIKLFLVQYITIRDGVLCNSL